MLNKLNAITMAALAAVLVSSSGFGVEDAKTSKKTAVSKKAKVSSQVLKPKAEEKKAQAAVPAPAPAVSPTTTDSLTTSAVAPMTPPAPVTTTAITESIAVPSAAGLKGSLELRPSWTSARGEVHTENTAELGYKFNKQTEFTYRQEFNTNVFDPTAVKDRGMDPVAKSGYFRADFKDIFVSSAAGLSFGYEPRLYMPTNSSFRDAGGIVAIRNYLKLKKTLGTKTSLSLMEIPIFHIYNGAGSVTATGPAANAAFENRVYLVFDWSIVEGKLDFSFPLMLNSVMYRNYQPGAKYNNSTQHQVWIYPELDYSLNKNLTLGLAYYVDGSFLSPDLSKFTFQDGFDSGVTQIVLRASL